VEFLTDKPQTLYDPFLLPDMPEAADEILSAVEDGLSICIYGDYDADGVTATSLMMDVLRTLGADCSYYIPSRFDDGYGLNDQAIDKIKAAGADMIITVDCGCTSAEEVRHARDIGLEIIVTDHHAMGEAVPDCLLIDPQRSDSRYPFRYLAGVGVAFKLAQALCREAGMEKRHRTSRRREQNARQIRTEGHQRPGTSGSERPYRRDRPQPRPHNLGKYLIRHNPSHQRRRPTLKRHARRPSHADERPEARSRTRLPDARGKR